MWTCSQRLYLFDVTVVQQFAATSSLDGTYSTQNGLVSAQPVRCEEGSGHVVLCKLLSGSGYRLRPTSKISEFIRDSSLLSKFGISLAEACKAGTRDGWRNGSRAQSNGDFASAAGEARGIPDRVCKTSRGVDRPERSLAAPLGQMNSPSREARPSRTVCEISVFVPNPRTRSKSCHAINSDAQLWCYCNTLSILTWRHNAGRIVCLHVDAQGHGPCEDYR